MKKHDVCVIGLGYIGLPTAAMFASRRLSVHGVDVNQSTVDTINDGRIHIVEPELDILVHSVVREEFLAASTKPEPAHAFIVAVPTPFKDNHEPDLSYIQAASEAIAPVLEKGDIVILESTSPVGATERMMEWLAANREDLRFPTDSNPGDVHIAHCPERVLPGHVVRELVENDRVIGGATPECAEAAVRLYRNFVTGECLRTTLRTAEMAKLTENAFRDVNIAFANELSIICDKFGIDVWELIDLTNRHPRVNVLRPGCGVGGHCIAVDPWFIVSQAGDDAKLIKTARLVNDYKPEYVVESVVDYCRAANLTRVACLGASFKPDIDDLRESPALKIITDLKEKIENLVVVEPNVESLPNSELDLVSLESIDDDCLVVVLVGHKQFVKAAGELGAREHLMDYTGVV